MQSLDPRCVAQAGKGQWIRVCDVFIIGPLMIWGGLTARGPTVARFALVGAGAGTVVFNAVNWFLVSSGKQAFTATQLRPNG